jgi:hypothetical protein
MIREVLSVEPENQEFGVNHVSGAFKYFKRKKSFQVDEPNS